MQFTYDQATASLVSSPTIALYPDLSVEASPSVETCAGGLAPPAPVGIQLPSWGSISVHGRKKLMGISLFNKRRGAGNQNGSSGSASAIPGIKIGFNSVVPPLCVSPPISSPDTSPNNNTNDVNECEPEHPLLPSSINKMTTRTSSVGDIICVRPAGILGRSSVPLPTLVSAGVAGIQSVALPRVVPSNGAVHKWISGEAMGVSSPMLPAVMGLFTRDLSKGALLRF